MVKLIELPIIVTIMAIVLLLISLDIIFEDKRIFDRFKYLVECMLNKALKLLQFLWDLMLCLIGAE